MRRIKGGINWVFYNTDTYEDACAWFTELTGVSPKYDWVIFKDRDGSFCFRLHR